MDRTGVARSLEQVASYLDFKGENPFVEFKNYLKTSIVAGGADVLNQDLERKDDQGHG